MNKENDDGMRYRGHSNHHKNNNNTNQHSSSKTDFRVASNNNNNNDDDDQQTHHHSYNNNNNNSHSQNHGSPATEEEAEKPLLAHDYSEGDESTNRGGPSSPQGDNSEENKTGLMTTIAGIARKVRCKFLDKLPISFATKFAVASPPEFRVATLRRFMDHHVNSVAAATAADDGLTPRQKHHIDMIKTLWERLNSRAPRCVRRRAGEEDEDICKEKLTGRVWGAFGFQGKDPATDFRGAGNLALEHMLYFVTKHPRTLEAIAETPADHAPITSHYPFAVASINISMLLLDMVKTVAYAPPPPPTSSTNGSSSSISASERNFNSNPSSAGPASPTSAANHSTNSTTGNYHIGTYSAIEARRKLCHFITDPSSGWQPPQPASSTVQNMNWTHKHFKKNLDNTMDDLFGPAVGEAQHKTQEEVRKSVMTQEEQELEMIAERLAAVYVAGCVMLHDQWLQSKRNVMYFNDVFKQTAAKMELLFRDSSSFAQVMNAVWKDY